MPEIPDVEVYVRALRARILGRTLREVSISHPFLLRTATPEADLAAGREVRTVERMGKRIVIALQGDVFLVLHLMIAGRLHWLPSGSGASKHRGLAAFDFENGTLILTEAGKKRRTSLHLVSGREELRAMDPGGLEVLESSVDDFAAALSRENHTLKRALTDPHILSGIGNAYSDEILHRARLSPFLRSQDLTRDEMARLHAAALMVLQEWTARLQAETGNGFPEKVTAFRPDMAVHGRFGLPCPVCGTAVQRIRYAQNEANYCPRCQTGGRILADRALSRLLKDDWPGTIEELERRSSAPRSLRRAPS